MFPFASTRTIFLFVQSFGEITDWLHLIIFCSAILRAVLFTCEEIRSAWLQVSETSVDPHRRGLLSCRLQRL